MFFVYLVSEINFYIQKHNHYFFFLFSVDYFELVYFPVLIKLCTDSKLLYTKGYPWLIYLDHTGTNPVLRMNSDRFIHCWYRHRSITNRSLNNFNRPRAASNLGRISSFIQARGINTWLSDKITWHTVPYTRPGLVKTSFPIISMLTRRLSFW